MSMVELHKSARLIRLLGCSLSSVHMTHIHTYTVVLIYYLSRLSVLRAE